MPKTLEELIKEFRKNILDFYVPVGNSGILNVNKVESIITQSFEAGREDLKKEILSKLPKRKGYCSGELDGETL